MGIISKNNTYDSCWVVRRTIHKSFGLSLYEVQSDVDIYTYYLTIHRYVKIPFLPLYIAIRDMEMNFVDEDPEKILMNYLEYTFYRKERFNKNLIYKLALLSYGYYNIYKVKKSFCKWLKDKEKK